MGKYRKLSLRLKAIVAVVLFSLVAISFASVIFTSNSLTPVESIQGNTFDDNIASEYNYSINEEDGERESNPWDEYDCDGGLSRCKRECSDVTITYPENGGTVESNDFESKCEDACKKGYNACDGEKNEFMCDNFKSICKRNCPTSVYDNSSGNDVSSYEAVEGCEDACKKGANECEF